MYSRLLSYCQRYRDIEYNQINDKSGKYDALKAKKMKFIKDRKQGHDLTKMKFFEIDSLCKLRCLKSFVEERLRNVKKVSN